jgi:hypothetical protein
VEVRPLLEQLEGTQDVEGALAYLAAQSIRFDPDEVRAARRRALLLLATGGDPRRRLEPGGRPVGSVARDLDAPGRRLELAGALAELRAAADGLASVARALDDLLEDADLAWRWVACALLAEELAGGDE